MVRDVRIFVNTIDRAVKMMTGSGIPATAEKREQADYIEYVCLLYTSVPSGTVFAACAARARAGRGTAHSG